MEVIRSPTVVVAMEQFLPPDFPYAHTVEAFERLSEKEREESDAHEGVAPRLNQQLRLFQFILTFSLRTAVRFRDMRADGTDLAYDVRVQQPDGPIRGTEVHKDDGPYEGAVNRTMTISLLDGATNTVVYPNGPPNREHLPYTNAGSALYFDAMTDHSAPSTREVKAKRAVVYFSVIYDRAVTPAEEMAALQMYLGVVRTSAEVEMQNDIRST